jgi:hypothetical protein
MTGKYSGMTVNERLYISGLVDAFDRATKQKDVDSAILILKSIELNDASIEPILQNLGLKKK